MKILSIIGFTLFLFTACGSKNTEHKAINKQAETANIEDNFNADSAFLFTKQQTDFGPRVPGSKAHQECAKFLSQKLKTYGAQVKIQDFEAKGYDGTIWQGKNIIASYLPNSKDRIMLCAHWDSRFIAEEEQNKALRLSPIDGANDGASGVGVLLEIARQLKLNKPNIGVDIVLFDVEDQGAPSYASSAETVDSWCLGSQYWAREANKSGYLAQWGILLDMVGAGDAVFMKEQISTYYASQLVDYVWMTAEQLGYSNYFQNKKGGIVTDDHLYVNKITNIPCIDIIDYDDTRGGFNSTWHTHNDNISNIDKATLKAVGDVVLHVIREQ